MRKTTRLLLLGLLLSALSCRSARLLSITSEPPGAAVRLDDREVGRTPLEVEFEHYGIRRVTLYCEGYRTHSEQIELSAPWYGRFPADLFTEVLFPIGYKDRRAYHVDLIQGEEVMSLPSLRSVIDRANAFRQAGPDGPTRLPEATPRLLPPGQAAPAEPTEKPR